MEMITPRDYVGALMELSQSRRGEFVDMQYLTELRAALTYNLPLAEVQSICHHQLCLNWSFLWCMIEADMTLCLCLSALL